MTEKHQPSKPTQYTRKKIQSYSYGLLDQIGKGYSSKVYRGRHDHTQQSVAVKVIDLKMLKNQINRELLNSQIDILKELKGCNNILYLQDIFTTKNNTYIVTELCVSDLSKLIKKGVKEADALHMMNSIITGYLQIYKKNIVHRDLKPANILITHNHQIKIADFGFAVKLQTLAKRSKYNVGSPLYMAPQSLKKNQYSFKSDIWALGIIFYQILFNDTPWRAKNQKELLKKIQSGSIQDIIQGKQISSNSKLFLSKCLVVDKNNRMSPEELQCFSFPTQKTNILGQKSINQIQKSLLVKDLKINSPQQLIKKVEEPQFKQVNIKKDKKPSGFDQNNHINRNQSVKAVNAANNKTISKILISEVHFCRFLFKLLQKIKQSAKYGLLKREYSQLISDITKNFSGIIKFKIQNLVNFQSHNYIKCQGYKQYKQSSDYIKIINISKQYAERYNTDLKDYWNQQYSLDIQPINRLILAIYQLLDHQVKTMECPQQQIFVLSKEVIILDYLITARQLIQMIRSTPQAYEKFAKKSRIQEIVQGKTVDINLSLYIQIMERVKQVMHKTQFVSFGGDLTAQNCLFA